jgi:rare lipoprotein A (peptidoglycan hydrolase)
MPWPLHSPVMRRVTRAFLISLGWPLLILVFAHGLQAPLASAPAAAPKAIKSWTGLASWYGPNFQGHTTASGQVYDMFAATAAHPWLPFGSLIRVVNLRNGHSQLVRINDRGPNLDDRELDVSFAAASRLGLLGRGLAMVRIDLLEEPKRP